MSFGITIIDGRIGKDVESRSTTNGKKVVSFSVASDYGFGDNKGTNWHNVVCWGQVAEFAEKYLKRGSGVVVVGEPRTRSYEDKQSGQTKYVTEIHADAVRFSNNGKSDSPENGQKSGRAAATPPARTQTAPAPRAAVADDPFGDETGITDDDIPF